MATWPNFREDRVEKDMWGLTPLDQLACRIEFKKMRYEGHFTPPMEGGGGYGQAQDSWGGSFQYPGNAGGFNWGSVSVDADNGLLVAAPMLMGNRIYLTTREDRAKATAHRAERLAAQRKASTLFSLLLEVAGDTAGAGQAPSPLHTDADIDHLVASLIEVWSAFGLKQAA
mgnify:CR=1 FL=1